VAAAAREIAPRAELELERIVLELMAEAREREANGAGAYSARSTDERNP
jgi:hypothetical protein